MSLEFSLEPTSALEAVNDMLRSIGQGQVNSLDLHEGVDAGNAISALITTSREVQERGWYFNTDYDYALVPEASGEIRLAHNMVQFEPDKRWAHVTERARKLYDRDAKTFTFDQGTQITGRVVWLFAFEDLPQAARTYIHRKAGRLFQIGAVGSDLLYRFTREMEEDALAALNRAHLRAERTNAITDDPHTFQTAARHRLKR